MNHLGVETANRQLQLFKRQYDQTDSMLLKVAPKDPSIKYQFYKRQNKLKDSD